MIHILILDLILDYVRLLLQWITVLILLHGIPSSKL